MGGLKLNQLLANLAANRYARLESSEFFSVYWVGYTDSVIYEKFRSSKEVQKKVNRF